MAQVVIVPGRFVAEIRQGNPLQICRKIRQGKLRYNSIIVNLLIGIYNVNMILENRFLIYISNISSLRT